MLTQYDCPSLPRDLKLIRFGRKHDKRLRPIIVILSFQDVVFCFITDLNKGVRCKLGDLLPSISIFRECTLNNCNVKHVISDFYVSNLMNQRREGNRSSVKYRNGEYFIVFGTNQIKKNLT